MLQSTKLIGAGVLKSILTSDMDVCMRLEFDQLGFGLTLVQYFITMFLSLYFGTVLYILLEQYCITYDIMLEVCDPIFFIL